VTRLVVRDVVRSQRIMPTLLLTFLIIAIVVPNGPQAPGAALAAAGLLMIPVHAWIGMSTAMATDRVTREAFIAVLGPVRVFGAHVGAAAIIAAGAEALMVLATVVSGAMSPMPSATRWLAGAFTIGAGLAVGVAIGVLAAPPVINQRGRRALVLVGLLACTPLVLPVLSLARKLADDHAARVVGDVGARAAVCAAAAAVLLAAGALVSALRRD
jgi:hypothetical protein